MHRDVQGVWFGVLLEAGTPEIVYICAYCLLN